MDTTQEDMKNWFGMWSSKQFADGSCYIIGAFANVGVIETNEGLILFDLAPRQLSNRVFNDLRKFSDKPIKYIIYSHGHFDHCFGYSLILKEIKRKGWEMPQIIAHENLLERFEKYRILDKYHTWLNRQQFASLGLPQQEGTVSAHDTLDPTIIIRGNENYKFQLEGFTFEIYHDKGETDDSLWMYFPEKKVLFAGDLAMNPSFPNVGNPNKVQRYPKHWAIAMEKMLEKNAEYLVPGHGQLIEGKESVRKFISIRADAMNFVHDEVVKRMNEGKWFEQIYHEMLDIYPERFNSEFIRPTYGCYRFAIHAVYRLYHGWYNSGNPTDLFPAKTRDVARELLDITSSEQYFNQANKLFERNKSQLALHLLDVIINGDENQTSEFFIKAIELKSQILKLKAAEEVSFIARNSYSNGAKELDAKLANLKDI